MARLAAHQVHRMVAIGRASQRHTMALKYRRPTQPARALFLHPSLPLPPTVLSTVVSLASHPIQRDTTSCQSAVGEGSPIGSLENGRWLAQRRRVVRPSDLISEWAEMCDWGLSLASGSPIRRAKRPPAQSQIFSGAALSKGSSQTGEQRSAAANHKGRQAHRYRCSVKAQLEGLSDGKKPSDGVHDRLGKFLTSTAFYICSPLLGLSSKSSGALACTVRWQHLFGGIWGHLGPTRVQHVSVHAGYLALGLNHGR